MNALFVGLVAVLGLGALPERAETVSQKILNEIAARGYRRVGVAPKFTVDQAGRKFFVDEAGLLVDQFPQILTEALIKGARRTRETTFETISLDQMRSLFSNMAESDYTDPKKIEVLTKTIGGIDAIVIGRIEDVTKYTGLKTTLIQGQDVKVFETVPSAERPQPIDDESIAQFNIKCRMIEAATGRVVMVADEELQLSLSDAAYLGESWELRRWTDAGQLTNIGLNDVGARGQKISPFGYGRAYELAHYALIRRDRSNPQLEPECPYKLSIRSGEGTIDLTPLGERLYAAIEPGDTYSIVVSSKSSKPTNLALYVDGVNVRGKVRDNPANAKLLLVPPRSDLTVAGWLEKDLPTGELASFMMVKGDDTVTAQLGVGDRIGQITAVFLTYGRDGLPEAPALKSGPLSGTFGTGLGKPVERGDLQLSNAPSGPILAAITIQYCTPRELDVIKRRARVNAARLTSAP